MKMKLLILLCTLFVTPLSANDTKGYPNWFTRKGYAAQVIAPCKDCGYKAPNPQELKRHIYFTHARKAPLLWKCNYVGCDRDFETMKDLMWHIDRGDHNIKQDQLYARGGCRR